MSKILVFGHKNPDTDSISSAVIMANLENKMGKEAIPCRLGEPNDETKFVFDYLKMEMPTKIESLENGQEVILVDHNEEAQSIENINEATILRIVDHHKIDFKISYPICYIAEPVGCTATVLYKLYKQNNIEIDRNIGMLMLSAIISDTLLFKSPTCTSEDVNIANELGKITGINIEEYGMEMLKAGTKLDNYTEEELLKIDAKEFAFGGAKAIVAQINTVDIQDVLKRQEKIEEAMKKEIENSNLDLFFFAITDILNCNSEVIAIGNRTDIVKKTYNTELENNRVFLPGVVSRKKQIVPVLTENA